MNNQDNSTSAAQQTKVQDHVSLDSIYSSLLELKKTGRTSTKSGALGYLMSLAKRNHQTGCPVDSTQQQEASHLNVSDRAVRSWEQRYDEFGLVEFHDHGRGKEKMVTDKGRAVIELQYPNFDYGERCITQVLKKDKNLTSDRTSDRTSDQPPPIPYTDTDEFKIKETNYLKGRPSVDKSKIKSHESKEVIQNINSLNPSKTDRFTFISYLRARDVSLKVFLSAWNMFEWYTDLNGLESVTKPLGLLRKYIDQELKFLSLNHEALYGLTADKVSSILGLMDSPSLDDKEKLFSILSTYVFEATKQPAIKKYN